MKKNKNKNKNINRNRNWKCLSNNIALADVQLIGKTNNNSNNYLLSIIKIRKKAHNSHIFPKWSFTFQNKDYKKDNVQVLSVLKDTLQEYIPGINIICNNQIIKGKITGIKGLESSDPLWVHRKTKHVMHLNIVVSDGLPPELINFQILIKSRLLPQNKYIYGFCNYGNSYIKCSDTQYIANILNHNLFYPSRKCNSFNLEKGNPQQFCSLKNSNRKDAYQKHTIPHGLSIDKNSKSPTW